jgi:hypothetical protein
VVISHDERARIVECELACKSPVAPRISINEFNCGTRFLTRLGAETHIDYCLAWRRPGIAPFVNLVHTAFFKFDNTKAVSTMPHSIPDVLKAFAAGEIVVVTDDDNCEGEGDLIVAASACTAEKMAFIVRHTSGIVCAPVTSEDACRLRLDPMVAHNDSNYSTAFTVSIDYKPGMTTGISAEERTASCRALANSNVGPNDFARPDQYIAHVLALDGYEHLAAFFDGFMTPQR